MTVLITTMGQCVNVSFITYIYRLEQSRNYLLYVYAVCSLTCKNGGIFNATSCSCECSDFYTGIMCESKLELEKYNHQFGL